MPTELCFWWQAPLTFGKHLKSSLHLDSPVFTLAVTQTGISGFKRRFKNFVLLNVSPAFYHVVFPFSPSISVIKFLKSTVKAVGHIDSVPFWALLENNTKFQSYPHNKDGISQKPSGTVVIVREFFLAMRQYPRFLFKSKGCRHLLYFIWCQLHPSGSKNLLLYLIRGKFKNKSPTTNTFYRLSSWQPVPNRHGGICIQWQLKVLVEINDHQNKTMNLHHCAAPRPRPPPQVVLSSVLALCITAPVLLSLPGNPPVRSSCQSIISGGGRWSSFQEKASSSSQHAHAVQNISILCVGHAIYLQASGHIRHDSTCATATRRESITSRALTLSGFAAVLLQTLIVKWNLSGLCLESFLSRLKRERQITWIGKDFSLNFGCIITQFWWAIAQGRLSQSLINPSPSLHHNLCLSALLSVPLSPHANIIMAPLTRTIANLFSMAAGVVNTFCKEIIVIFHGKSGFSFPQKSSRNEQIGSYMVRKDDKKYMRVFYHILQACTRMTFKFYPSLRPPVFSFARDVDASAALLYTLLLYWHIKTDIIETCQWK